MGWKRKVESFYRLTGHSLDVTHPSAPSGHLARPCFPRPLFVQHLSASFSAGHAPVSRAANPARPLHATPALALTCFPVLNKSGPPVNPPGSESCARKVTLRWCSLCRGKNLFLAFFNYRICVLLAHTRLFTPHRVSSAIKTDLTVSIRSYERFASVCVWGSHSPGRLSKVTQAEFGDRFQKAS